MEYQGRADSLVVIWSVDPSGLRQETLLWRRPAGDPLRLTLKAGDPAHLPAGLASIDWRIDPDGEGPLTLDPVDGPLLSGWRDLRAFLQERWQGRTGRVAVQVDSTALAVDLAHPEAVDRLVDYLQDQSRRSLGEARAPLVQVLLSPYAFDRSLALLADSIVLNAYVVLVPGSELEQWALWSLSRSSGPVTLSEAAAVTRLVAPGRDIVDVGPLAALIGLELLNLRDNGIVDVSPLASLTSLEWLELGSNDIVDVGPLASLTSLKELHLRRNDIVDVGPLASLTGLKELWLGLQRYRRCEPSGCPDWPGRAGSIEERYRRREPSGLLDRPERAVAELQRYRRCEPSGGPDRPGRAGSVGERYRRREPPGLPGQPGTAGSAEQSRRRELSGHLDQPERAGAGLQPDRRRESPGGPDRIGTAGQAGSIGKPDRRRESPRRPYQPETAGSGLPIRTGRPPPPSTWDLWQL